MTGTQISDFAYVDSKRAMINCLGDDFGCQPSPFGEIDMKMDMDSRSKELAVTNLAFEIALHRCGPNSVPDSEDYEMAELLCSW